MGKLFCISGKRGIGKSYLVENLIKKCKERNIKVSGFFTRGQKNRLFVNVKDGTEWPFNKGKGSIVKIGNFIITEEAFKFAKNTLMETNTDLIIIDEIGRLEFAKKGLYSEILKLLQTNKNTILAVFRLDYLNLIDEIFNVNVDQEWIIERREDQEYLLNNILKELIHN